MNKEENKALLLKIESLVNPEDVTAISFLGDFNKLLPKTLQQYIMKKGSQKIPYMGFIVDPYCFFLSYEIKDKVAAEAMLPEKYELAEVSFFENDPKRPMIIISAFSARTSAFNGMRLEFYIIARSKESGLVSWIIADYETNTNSHDPKNGFCGYSCSSSACTVSPYGELLVDVKGRRCGREFFVSADITKGAMKNLDQTLWVEGNLTVDYGGDLKSETSEPFSLIFDPFLMKEAKNIAIEDVEIIKNTYFNTIIDVDKPVTAAVFPYGQHFIIKQDLAGKGLRKKEDLYNQIKIFTDRTGFKFMSGKDLKGPLLRGFIVASLINIGIILFLLSKILL